jgi:Radical SAM superfamily/4Fe-4S single cluster domain
MDAQFQPLDPAKFRDPSVTAKGEARATVALRSLDTLWFNTGTLCNLTCRNCYIESSPRNDRLAYLTRDEVREYLDEIARERLATKLIGFTGGEPFMNPDIIAMLDDVLSRGFDALVLTNAMKPLRRLRPQLLALRETYGDRPRIRVSLDHYDQAVHEAERGRRSWAPTIDGLVWLARNGFAIDVAGRRFSGEPEAELRAGFARVFAELDLPVDAADPVRLMLFPEMDAQRDVPEITTACWGILHKSPDDVMCASARMVVKRSGATAPAVLACTLLAYDPQFELGRTLAEAARPVSLNHSYCASFCVLGGAACSR